MKTAQKKAPAGTVKKVVGYVSGHMPLIVLSLFSAAVNVALTLYIPMLFGRAIDLIGEGNSAGAVDPQLIKTAVLTVFCALSAWLMSRMNNRITYRTARDIRNDIYGKIGKLPLSSLDSRPAGDTVSRMVSDTERFSDGLLMGFSRFFTGILTIAGTLFFMLRLSGTIALVVVCLTPVSLFAARFIATRSYKYFTGRSEVNAEQTSLINESISNLKTVKAFSKEKDISAEFDEINGRLKEVSLKAIFFSSLTNPCTRFVNSVVYAAAAFTGAAAVISAKGSMTVGMLTCVLSYAAQYAKPFNEISGVAAELQSALASAARIFELTEEAEELPSPDEEELPENCAGNIEISSVNFSYDGKKQILNGVSVSARAGQKIAIVGATGCGKTTLINLLMRFYDADGGTITLDGTDIKKLSRSSLRRQFGMVLQDTWLMPGTVRENITLGRPDATDEEITEAARLAHSLSFIKKLPDGFDTVIGEDGGALSEGQKQLLCITRVMLCLPPVLLLDEATSSIDTRTELKVQKAFDGLTDGRTSFIVAHRLSTVIGADKIIVMDKGTVAEQGTHEELMKKNGIYAGLIRKQLTV